MSSTVDEVIRQIKYLKLQRQNSDEIKELSEQFDNLSKDHEKLAKANLKLIKKIKEVLGTKEIEEPEEDEDQEEFEDDEEEEEDQNPYEDKNGNVIKIDREAIPDEDEPEYPEEDDEEELQDRDYNYEHDEYFEAERDVIKTLVDKKYHKKALGNSSDLSTKNHHSIKFDLPKAWKIELEIRYVPLLNGKFCGGWNYSYSLGGHHSPIEFVRRHFESLEKLKEHYIKLFLQVVQNDYARGKHMTNLGKNASKIFKYFDKYTHLLIDKKIEEKKPKTKPKKKPNKKEIIKDTSKGILKEYHEIFNKINYQDATKFETMINLFEKFSNKMKSIKNYPDRELKKPFKFNWSNSSFVFPCKNVVQFESDFLEFFKKMGRKKASLFYPFQI
jgi:hypothetical protein